MSTDEIKFIKQFLEGLKKMQIAVVGTDKYAEKQKKMLQNIIDKLENENKCIFCNNINNEQCKKTNGKGCSNFKSNL